MELNDKAKDLLAIKRFLNEFKEQFKFNKVYIESFIPSGSSHFDPERNLYPISIIAEKESKKWNFNWTDSDQRASSGKKPSVFFVFYSSEVTDRYCNIYGYNAARDTIKHMFPEAFKSSFYERAYKLDTSNIDEVISPILNAIELSSNLPNNEKQFNKKLKV